MSNSPRDAILGNTDRPPLKQVNKASGTARSASAAAAATGSRFHGLDVGPGDAIRAPSATFLRIFHALADGERESTISARLDVSRQYVVTVRQRIEAMGLLAGRPRLSTSERRERRAKVEALARAGLPARQIAKELQLSLSYIETICRRLGIACGEIAARGLSEQGRQARLAAKCLSGLVVGLPPAQIRKRYRVSEHYLHQLKQIARDEGLVMQPPGCKLSGEAIRYIRMALRFLSPTQAATAFGITEKTVRRISTQPPITTKS